MDPKVTGSTFTGVFLCALGSIRAACPLFRMRFSMACFRPDGLRFGEHGLACGWCLNVRRRRFESF